MDKATREKIEEALVQSWRETLSADEIKLVDGGNYRVYVEDGRLKVAPIDAALKE